MPPSAISDDEIEAMYRRWDDDPWLSSNELAYLERRFPKRRETEESCVIGFRAGVLAAVRALNAKEPGL